LIAVDARFLGEVVVVGDDHAALAPGHDLGGVEGEARGLAELAGRPPVEGTAVRVTDQQRLARLADSWRSKYHGDWDFEVRDGMFHHDGGDALVFAVAPTKVISFAKGDFAQTRFRFTP